MLRAVLVLGLAVSAGAVTSAPTGPDPAWSRVRSPHFEVLTDAGAPLAQHAAERLEQLRLVLRVLFPPRTDAERRIVVIVLASRTRFEPLVPRVTGRPGRSPASSRLAASGTRSWRSSRSKAADRLPRSTTSTRTSS